MDFSVTEPTLEIAIARFPANATAEMQAVAEVTRKHQQEANNL